ncbi:MAG TPA: hypothetical protein VF669_13635 [Tepidisphaeraceae bacterium]|jgi:hypothetical protein
MTAPSLYRQCQTAGIRLVPDGNGIVFDAPAGVAVPVEEIRHRKSELLAMLRGDYTSAAAALLLKVEDPEEREELAYLFDERAGICQYEGGMSRPEAERQAYLELVDA